MTSPFHQPLFQVSANSTSTVPRTPQPRQGGFGPPSFHGTPLTVSWLLLIDLAVIVAALRWQKYSFYIHVLFALVVIGLTLAAVIPVLMKYFLFRETDRVIMKAHKVAGFMVAVWLGVQILTGIASRAVQCSEKVKPQIVNLLKMIHNGSGYLLMVLAKFNYLNANFDRQGNAQTSFILLLLADIALIVIYIWIKFAYWTLSEQTVDSQIKLTEKNDGEIEKKQSQGIAKLETASQIIKNNKPNSDDFNNAQHNPELRAENGSATTDSKKEQQKSRQQKLKALFLEHCDTRYSSDSQIPLENYVLFNDFVYDISEFSGRHPGGEKLIRLMNKREVNRFMYGSYSAQLAPGMKPWRHSRDAMRLVGPPVAMIERSTPIQGLDDYNKVSIQSKSVVSNSSNPTFLLRLRVESGERVVWRGFTEMGQIGQFFGLTISDRRGWNRVTRLYTSIWCMRGENVDRMGKWFKGLRQQIEQRQKTMSSTSSNSNRNNSNNLQQANQHSIIIQTNNILEAPNSLPIHAHPKEPIPLVIKRYEKGELTQRLLHNPAFEGEMILSKPMGAGMKYGEIMQEGKVIIVCGGTGLLPFCDFIDLLFKRVLILQGHPSSQEFSTSDPLIKEDLLKHRSFRLYCAAQSITDLLPLTLFQIDHLSRSSKISFESTMRISRNPQELGKKYTQIRTQRQFFNQNIKSQLKYGSISQIYICGPPAMNSAIGELMIDQKVEEDRYHFM